MDRPLPALAWIAASLALHRWCSSLVPPVPDESTPLEALSRPWQAAGRGPDFAVHQQIQAYRADSGEVAFRTNRFTLIENALHYFEDGQWKESENLIEPVSRGRG